MALFGPITKAVTTSSGTAGDDEYLRLGLAGRARLLGLLRQAGWPVVAGVVGTQLLLAAVPAGTAVALAFVVSKVETTGSGGALGPLVASLVVYGAVLWLTQAVSALILPLQLLAKLRIDGARRGGVVRLAAGSTTIEVLERPDVREMMRLAKAWPRNWSERTPGDGALGQLSALSSLAAVVMSCAVVASFSLWLVPVVLVPAGVARALSLRLGHRYMAQWRLGVREGMAAEVWDAMLVKPVAGKEVRVFGFAELAAGRSGTHRAAMFEPVWAVGMHWIRAQVATFVLVGGGLGICFAVVVDAAARGHVSVAVMTAVLLAAWSVSQVLSFYNAWAVQGALPGEQAYRSLEDLLGPGVRPSLPGLPRKAGPGTPSVCFEAVAFRYPGAPAPVLDGLELQVRPGELLAVVGLNGAGKSTLVKLLSGLYRPTAGQVTADGQDIWAGIDEWRQRISVAFQDPARYPLSLKENIVLGRPSEHPDDDAVLAAIEEAGLAAVVDGLPQGLRTLLSTSRSGGVELSGGQWQQVVLARVLYALRLGAGLLVLDEPTAHLDVRSELEIFSRLANRRGAASIVLVSHRLSTVRQADRIVLVEGGRVAECGSHEELMVASGTYARMFTSQAERFQAGYDDRFEESDLA